MRTEPIRIAIIDDSKSMRSALRQSLQHQEEFSIVLISRNGDEFLKAVKKLDEQAYPEIVITDIHMPGLNGIEVVRHAKALYPKMKFLMLTVSDHDDLIYEAIQSGASGYLLKNEKISVIRDHILQLYTEDRAPMSPEITRKVVDLLSRRGSEAAQDADMPVEEKYNLTQREGEVLHKLVAGLNYKEIATELHISPYTVRTHIANLYAKLHVSSKAQVINLVHQKTYENTSNPCIDAGESSRILLVDDHQIILDSLSMMLSASPRFKISGTLNDPADVEGFLAQHSIDLLISDVNMPGMSGIELAEWMRRHFPQVKILLLTVSDDLELAQRACTIGVDGYILKKTGKEDLTAAIDTILDGNSYFGPFSPLEQH